MNNYLVTYSGNCTKLNNKQWDILADTEREAVELIYQQVMDDNYFPQDDGSIKDCSGHTVADEDDDTIEYDGGCFSAEIID